MRRGIRNALSIGTLTAGLAMAGASPAKAQIRFEGSLPVPNGRITIGIGGQGFRAGAAVPYGYEIYSHPDYGYGFAYRSQWIPVERIGSRWVVVARPLRYARADRADWRFARPYERWEERRNVGRARTETRYDSGKDRGRGNDRRSDGRRDDRDRFQR